MYIDKVDPNDIIFYDSSFDPENKKEILENPQDYFILGEQYYAVNKRG